MCGSFFVDAKNCEIDRLLEWLPDDSPHVNSGDVYPGQIALTRVASKGEAVSRAMQWGLPLRDEKGVIFNARCESALEKPMFRKGLLNFRAAIPVNGFYEWQTTPDSPRKTRYLFQAEDNFLLYLGGFYNSYTTGPCHLAQRFVVLTTRANTFMAAYHHRMPVLLKENEVGSWLYGQDWREFLTREQINLKAMIMNPPARSAPMRANQLF